MAVFLTSFPSSSFPTITMEANHNETKATGARSVHLEPWSMDRKLPSDYNGGYGGPFDKEREIWGFVYYQMNGSGMKRVRVELRHMQSDVSALLILRSENKADGSLDVAVESEDIPLAYVKALHFKEDSPRVEAIKRILEHYCSGKWRYAQYDE